MSLSERDRQRQQRSHDNFDAVLKGEPTGPPTQRQQRRPPSQSQNSYQYQQQNGQYGYPPERTGANTEPIGVNRNSVPTQQMREDYPRSRHSPSVHSSGMERSSSMADSLGGSEAAKRKRREKFMPVEKKGEELYDDRDRIRPGG